MKKLKLEEEEERIGGVFYQQIYIYIQYMARVCVCIYIICRVHSFQGQSMNEQDKVFRIGSMLSFNDYSRISLTRTGSSTELGLRSPC